MTAGEFLAGEMDPAGEDPPAAAPPPRRVTLPRALLFDGATRTYPIDGDGRLIDAHPVDHEVALAVLVELGAITSAPSTGSTLRRVKYLGGPTLKTEVAERLRTAIKAIEMPRAGRVTASFGVAECPSDAQTAFDIVKASDIALYEAKRNGRDRVVAMSSDISNSMAAGDVQGDETLGLASRG